MRQLVQYLKDGTMELAEVPFPSLGKGQVLVRNNYSVISAGTEGKTVKDARLGYLGKARARQKDVNKVIKALKTQGVSSTYKMVINKLDAPSVLGYSCAGEVIGVGDDVRGFRVGDFVACGGSDAVHAEVVAVSKNLCAKIPDGVDLKRAAFTTIASIAMQGVRRADLSLGENCVVIGLGLIGQLTIQLLNASGIQSIGIDTDEHKVRLCEAKLSLERNRVDIEDAIINFTDGYGADAVIITAGTGSLDPIEFAGILCRKKGRVVIVGAVPTGFSRDNYYKKELDLRMSTSYGPGRYDPQYEEKGIDYPIGYVRWTENRNMMSCLQFMKDQTIDIEKYITHKFNFEKAPEAYQLILDPIKSYVGVVLEYDVKKRVNRSITLNNSHIPIHNINVGFIGAGAFAQNFLLSQIKGNANLVGVATAHGNTSFNIARKYGFQFATDDADEIISNDTINTVFIVTRHDLHAQYVLKALRNKKNVFVEKPLAMTIEELEEIKKVYEESGSEARLMLGFNRRFASHINKMMSIFSKRSPRAITYRINAGAVPNDHWVHDKDVGGGRIIGEVCHFIDLTMFIAESGITSLSAQVMKKPNNLLDTLVVNIGFENGSIANISYFSNGNKRVAKEYLEVFSGGQVVIIDDFKKMTICSHKTSKYRLLKQDKGYSEEVVQFIDAIKEGSPLPIAFEDIYLSTLATFKILESIRNNSTVIIN